MNRFGKLAIISSGALLLIGSFTACSHKYKDPEYRAGKMVSIVAHKLELNEMQKGKLEKLSERMLHARKTMREGISSNKDEIGNLLSQATLDEKKILGMVSEHTRMINRQAPEIVSAMADFYNSLNPEQRTELREHIDKMHQRHGHHHNHHG